MNNSNEPTGEEPLDHALLQASAGALYRVLADILYQLDYGEDSGIDYMIRGAAMEEGRALVARIRGEKYPPDDEQDELPF